MRTTEHSISQWLPCSVPPWVPNLIGTWGGDSVQTAVTCCSLCYIFPFNVINHPLPMCNVTMSGFSETVYVRSMCPTPSVLLVPARSLLCEMEVRSTHIVQRKIIMTVVVYLYAATLICLG